MKKLTKVLVVIHIIAFVMAQHLSMTYLFFYIDVLHEDKTELALVYVILFVIPMSMSYTLFSVAAVKKQLKDATLKLLMKIDSYAFITIAVALLLLWSDPERLRNILIIECIVIVLRVISVISVKLIKRIHEK